MLKIFNFSAHSLSLISDHSHLRFPVVRWVCFGSQKIFSAPLPPICHLPIFLHHHHIYFRAITPPRAPSQCLLPHQSGATPAAPWKRPASIHSIHTGTTSTRRMFSQTRYHRERFNCRHDTTLFGDLCEVGYDTTTECGSHVCDYT